MNLKCARTSCHRDRGKMSFERKKTEESLKLEAIELRRSLLARRSFEGIYYCNEKANDTTLYINIYYAILFSFLY